MVKGVPVRILVGALIFLLVGISWNAFGVGSEVVPPQGSVDAFLIVDATASGNNSTVSYTRVEGENIEAYLTERGHQEDVYEWFLAEGLVKEEGNGSANATATDQEGTLEKLRNVSPFLFMPLCNRKKRRGCCWFHAEELGRKLMKGEITVKEYLEELKKGKSNK